MRRVGRAKRDVLDAVRIRATTMGPGSDATDEARRQVEGEIWQALGRLDVKLWYTRRARFARWLQEQARVRGMLRR